jgi:hypothetical protein
VSRDDGPNIELTLYFGSGVVLVERGEQTGMNLLSTTLESPATQGRPIS